MAVLALDVSGVFQIIQRSLHCARREMQVAGYRFDTRPAAPAACAVYTCGELTLDTASHAVRAAGRPVQLTRTEYAILKLLMQNPGQVLAKSVLLDRISADTPDCTESSLKTHVSNLRGKLRAVSGRDYVEAVWGIGFRLAAES